MILKFVKTIRTEIEVCKNAKVLLKTLTRDTKKMLFFQESANKKVYKN